MAPTPVTTTRWAPRMRREKKSSLVMSPFKKLHATMRAVSGRLPQSKNCFIHSRGPSSSVTDAAPARFALARRLAVSSSIGPKLSTALVAAWIASRQTDPAAWFTRIHPEDRQRVHAELLKPAAPGGMHFQSEHRIRHEDGDYRWVLVRGVRVVDVSARGCWLEADQTAYVAADTPEEIAADIPAENERRRKDIRDAKIKAD